MLAIKAQWDIFFVIDNSYSVTWYPIWVRAFTQSPGAHLASFLQNLKNSSHCYFHDSVLFRTLHTFRSYMVMFHVVLGRRHIGLQSNTLLSTNGELWVTVIFSCIEITNCLRLTCISTELHVFNVSYGSISTLKNPASTNNVRRENYLE